MTGAPLRRNAVLESYELTLFGTTTSLYLIDCPDPIIPALLYLSISPSDGYLVDMKLIILLALPIGHAAGRWVLKPGDRTKDSRHPSG